MDFVSAGLILSNQDTDLVELLKSPTTGKYKKLSITKKIGWVQETESVLELWYKNNKIMRYGTYNDYYGFKTSTKAAVQDAIAKVKQLDIDSASGLVLKIKRTITNTPAVITDEGDEKRKIRGKYFESGNNLFLNKPKLIKELKSIYEKPYDNCYDRIIEIRREIALQAKTVELDVIVWDSINGYTPEGLK